MKKVKLHICKSNCDISHKVWNDNFSENPIFKGECIHHINGLHEDNRPENLQKMTRGEHNIVHHTGENHHMYGKTHPKEYRQKMSVATSGKKNGMYGKRHKPESIQKMRDSSLGKKASPETRQKMSESQKGEKGHMYGKTLSKETRQKISETKKKNAIKRTKND